MSEEDCVKRWLSGLAESTQNRWPPILQDFFRFVKLSPVEAVKWQRLNPFEYRLVDAIYDWIEAHGGLALSTKKLWASIVRGFFGANRVPLPYDKHRFHSDRIPVVCGFENGVGDLEKILHSCDETHRAAFMVEFQSGGTPGETIFISHEHNQYIREEIKKGGRIIRLDMPGHKHSFGRLPYYTFIGDDAITCLKSMFKKQGYKEKPTLFVNQYDEPLTKHDLQAYFTVHAIKLGLIKPATKPCEKCGGETSRVRSRKFREDRRIVYVCSNCGNVQLSSFSAREKGGIRYKIKTYELRDLFKTECHRSLQSNNNFDLTVADFLMGHTIDKLGYDKLMKDWKYGLSEYRKVLSFLNVLSENPRVIDRNEINVELEKSHGEVEALKQQMFEMRRDSAAFHEISEILRDPEKLRRFKEILKD